MSTEALHEELRKAVWKCVGFWNMYGERASGTPEDPCWKALMDVASRHPLVQIQVIEALIERYYDEPMDDGSYYDFESFMQRMADQIKSKGLKLEMDPPIR